MLSLLTLSSTFPAPPRGPGQMAGKDLARSLEGGLGFLPEPPRAGKERPVDAMAEPPPHASVPPPALRFFASDAAKLPRAHLITLLLELARGPAARTSAAPPRTAPSTRALALHVLHAVAWALQEPAILRTVLPGVASALARLVRDDARQRGPALAEAASCLGTLVVTCFGGGGCSGGSDGSDSRARALQQLRQAVEARPNAPDSGKAQSPDAAERTCAVLRSVLSARLLRASQWRQRAALAALAGRVVLHCASQLAPALVDAAHTLVACAADAHAPVAAAAQCGMDALPRLLSPPDRSQGPDGPVSGWSPLRAATLRRELADAVRRAVSSAPRTLRMRGGEEALGALQLLRGFGALMRRGPGDAVGGGGALASALTGSEPHLASAVAHTLALDAGVAADASEAPTPLGQRGDAASSVPAAAAVAAEYAQRTAYLRRRYQWLPSPAHEAEALGWVRALGGSALACRLVEELLTRGPAAEAMRPPLAAEAGAGLPLSRRRTAGAVAVPAASPKTSRPALLGGPVDDADARARGGGTAEGAMVALIELLRAEGPSEGHAAAAERVLDAALDAALWEWPCTANEAGAGGGGGGGVVASWAALQRAARLRALLCEAVAAAAAAPLAPGVREAHVAHLLFTLVRQLAAPNAAVRAASARCLEEVAAACGHASSAAMLAARMDMLVDGLCARLELVEAYPDTPRVVRALWAVAGAGAGPLLREVHLAAGQALELRWDAGAEAARPLFALEAGIAASVEEHASAALAAARAKHGAAVTPEGGVCGPARTARELAARLPRWATRAGVDEAAVAAVLAHRRVGTLVGEYMAATGVGDEGEGEDKKSGGAAYDGDDEACVVRTVGALRVGAEAARRMQHHVAHEDAFARQYALEVVATTARALHAAEQELRCRGVDPESGALRGQEGADSQGPPPTHRKLPQLRPLLHELWPALVSRLRDPHPAVASSAVTLVASVAALTSDFLRHRFQEEAWPLWARRLREGRVDTLCRSGALSWQGRAAGWVLAGSGGGSGKGSSRADTPLRRGDVVLPQHDRSAGPRGLTLREAAARRNAADVVHAGATKLQRAVLVAVEEMAGHSASVVRPCARLIAVEVAPYLDPRVPDVLVGAARHALARLARFAPAAVHAAVQSLPFSADGLHDLGSDGNVAREARTALLLQEEPPSTK